MHLDGEVDNEYDTDQHQYHYRDDQYLRDLFHCKIKEINLQTVDRDGRDYKINRSIDTFDRDYLIIFVFSETILDPARISSAIFVEQVFYIELLIVITTLVLLVGCDSRVVLNNFRNIIYNVNL